MNTGLARLLGVGAALSGVGLPLAAAISLGGQFAAGAMTKGKPSLGQGKFFQDQRAQARQGLRQFGRELPWNYLMSTAGDVATLAMYPEIGQGVQNWLGGLNLFGPGQGAAVPGAGWGA